MLLLTYVRVEFGRVVV